MRTGLINNIWVVVCGIFLVLVIGGLCSRWEKERKRCMKFDNEHKIVAVGGCDESGKCSALLDNGRKVETYLPVVGQLYYCRF